MSRLPRRRNEAAYKKQSQQRQYEQTVYDSVRGKAVVIEGFVGGRIHVNPEGAVKTGGTHPSTTFVVEPSPIKGKDQMVVFRLEGTNRFLTQHPYGDEAKAQLANAFAAMDPLPFPVELVGKMIDLSVGDETKADNFEGKGFHYLPMSLTEGPPGILQSFHLEGSSLGAVGVKSPFGKYWRSQHWDHVISQSPHMLADETWRFYVRSG